MRKSAILGLIAMFCVGLQAVPRDQERDYGRLFRSIKQYTAPADYSRVWAQQVEADEEIRGILENGLGTSNLFSPYISGKKDLKELVGELSTYRFTLRSAKSSEIYQKAVYATALIVAPDIGSGSGFMVDKQRGLIVTNFHVTGGLKDLLVAFYDENIQDPEKMKFFPASVIRYNAKKDIAILKLRSVPPSAQQLYVETMIKLKVGETVHTIGHPMSLTWTYSSGLVTAIRNSFQFGREERADVIQIDANISPGNSGGPLMDEAGNVIGMVTFSSGEEGAQNLNFAISGKEVSGVLGSQANVDTQVTTVVGKLKGIPIITVSMLLEECSPFLIDEDNDGKADYTSFRDKKSQKETWRYWKRIEVEIEPGNKAKANVLCTVDTAIQMAMYDFNLDGKFEIVLIDLDGDSEPDIVGADLEGKGVITVVRIL